MAGRLHDAELKVREVLRRCPDHADALHVLGTIAHQTGNHEAAANLIGSAVAGASDAFACRVNLGSVLTSLGRLDAAEASLRRALEIRPRSAAAHNNLGIVLRKQGRLVDAVACYGRAVDLEPGYAEAHNNLGNALRDRGDADRALVSFREALRIRPDFAEAHNNLGNALRDARELDQATACHREALCHKPDYAEAHFNLGNTLKLQGRSDEALASYRRALRARPDLAETDDHRSAWLLAQGRLEEGWREFEWRSTLGSLGPFTEKTWNGEDLAGRTLLVWGEQGIGDQIMFGTCIPDAIERAGHCIIECDRRLVPLFARSFPAATVHGEVKFTGGGPSQWANFDWLADCPPVDHFVPEGSLPRYFRPTLESFPAKGSYLVADPERTAAWRRRLAGMGPGPKVGVCWRSIHLTEKRAAMYPPIESWAPVFALAGLGFVAVQANPSGAELAEIGDRFGVTLTTWRDLDLMDDLDGTAALLAALDAVVSADTYLPMMAGGLGLPVWRVTRGRKQEDWGALGAERYPWFPSITACYGESEDDLRGAFETAAAGLSGLTPGA